MGPRSEDRGWRPNALIRGRGIVGVVRASLGPRSELRVRTAAEASLVCDAQLQWGHDPKTVDGGGRPGVTSGGRPSFNGATIRRPWMDGLQIIWLSAGPASMGPRSEDRGWESGILACSPRDFRRFNGATIRRPWMERPTPSHKPRGFAETSASAACQAIPRPIQNSLLGSDAMVAKPVGESNASATGGYSALAALAQETGPNRLMIDSVVKDRPAQKILTSRTRVSIGLPMERIRRFL